MERYCRQLLSDIRQAKANVPQPWWLFTNWEDTILPWTEDVKNAPRKSLEEWTGLKKEALPPADLLTDTQMRSLLQELKDMLGEYNCHVVFQISVPERTQYEVIRQRYDQHSPLLYANMHFFEFCDPGEKRGNCLLGDYCHCRFFDNLLADHAEDGIDFETGHSFLFDGAADDPSEDSSDSSYFFLDDVPEGEYDDQESPEWDDEDEDEEWGIW